MSASQHEHQFDEKAGFLQDELDDHNKPPKQPGFGHVLFKRLLQASIVCIILEGLWVLSGNVGIFGSYPPKASHTEVEYGVLDLEDITPSEHLHWQPCNKNHPESLQCARLTVPMDYNRPLNESCSNPKVHIALVMVPGSHKGSEKYSSSPLLLNPGGPGGSGVDIATIIGEQIQKIVGTDQDVIGFDPRGIGSTTPRADCFAYPLPGSNEEDVASGAFSRLVWAAEGRQIGLANSSSEALRLLNARAHSLAQLCARKDSMSGSDSILKHVATPNVARDMLSIIDAWDAMRAREENPKPALMDSITTKTSKSSSGLSYSKRTEGKLVYWGFSYGTLLGATFASMFPNRVGRMILDGVVDADQYVSPAWMDSLQDADAVWSSFSQYCHEAGSKCQLYRSGDKISDLSDRVQGVLDSLKEEPIIGISPISNFPSILTFSDLRGLVFAILYVPTVGFAPLASILDLIYRGYGGIIAAAMAIPPKEAVCGPSLPDRAYPGDAQNAIMCSDKRYPLNQTLPELEGMLENMANYSSFADIWMTLMIGCENWSIKSVDPPMDWDNHPAHKQKPIDTSFPLLFISNRADPVTPLAAGIKMSRKFTDSGLVQQQSEGHCSLAAVSLCTIGKVRAYIRDGVVPRHPKLSCSTGEPDQESWDICEADEWPFHPFEPQQYVAINGGSGEMKSKAEILTAWKKVQEGMQLLALWGSQSDLTRQAILQDWTLQ